MIKNVSVVLLHICLSVRKTTSYSFIGGKKNLSSPPSRYQIRQRKLTKKSSHTISNVWFCFFARKK